MRRWSLRPRAWWFACLATAVMAGAGGLAFGTAGTADAAVTADAVAIPGPPMGWASWNTFASKINSQVIKDQTDALATGGLADAGYRYVNIDEGWWQGSRDGDGNITVDTTEWPGGMQAIADYIHSKGLKAGIYTDAGKDGCGYYFPTGRPADPGSGSEGHYEQDMTQFARWGFDFVKVDWCGGDAEKLDPEATYRAISAAVDKAATVTGHRLVLSICNWGRNNPWNWAPGVGTMWRTSDDIILFGQQATLGQVLTNFDKAQHPVAHHTGYHNDPDMLTVGMPGLTDAQGRTEMNLWAVTGAPLLAGNNLATMSAATRAILTNKDVIAVDQDPRGLPGVKVAEDAPGLQAYAKVLAGSGRRAVVLLNRTNTDAAMSVRWRDLGLTDSGAQVHDVWTGTTGPGLTDGYQVNVPANGSAMITVSGTEAPPTTYEAEAAGNTRAGSAAVVACPQCSGGSAVGSVGNGAANTLTITGIGAPANGLAVATIAYVNGDSTGRTATMTVGGQVPTVVAFPPTGSWTTPGTVSVVVSLRKGATNTITFGNSSAWAPDLDALTVAPLAGTFGTEVVGKQSNRCLDIVNNTTTDGTPAELWDCGGGTNQNWAYTSRKELVVYGNRCLDDWGHGTANGTKVALYSCTGGPNQQWTVTGDGTIANVESGLCLDARNGTGNGSTVVLWTCDATAASQQWSLDLPTPKPTPSGSPTPTSSPTGSPSPTGTPTPTQSPTTTPSPTPTDHPTASPSVSPTATAPPTTTGTPTASPSVSPTATAPPTTTGSPTPSASASPTSASPGPSTAAAGTPSPANPGQTGGLAKTGDPTIVVAGVGAVTLAFGIFLYGVSRRRKQSRGDAI